MDAKNPAKGFGAIVAAGDWYWYDRWVGVVRQHCADQAGKYK
jgi:hypothetical protein